MQSGKRHTSLTLIYTISSFVNNTELQQISSNMGQPLLPVCESDCLKPSMIPPTMEIQLIHLILSIKYCPSYYV